MRQLLLLLSLLSSVAEATTIWVEREGYHTAIVVPASVVAAQAPGLVPIVGAKALIRFGWGDEDFYGAHRKTAGMAVRALLLSNRSVVEVGSFDRLAEVGRDVVAVEVDAEGEQRLGLFLRDSFALDDAGHPVLARSEPTGLRYYRARGRYHLLKNCNTWTARGLDRSGLELPARAMILAGQVMRRVKRQAAGPA